MVPSPLATSLAALAVLLAVVFVLGVRGRHGTRDERRRWTLRAIAIAAGYLGLSAALAASGALADLDARPPLVMVVSLSLAAVTIGLGLSRVGERLLTWPLAAIVGYQAYRLLLQWWFAAAHDEGVIPVVMTSLGYNLDDVTAALAVGLALWLWRGTPPRWTLWAWNLIGLGLLLVAASVAAMSGTGILETTPRLTILASWPGVWIPMWLVQMNLLGHVLVFRALRRPPAAAADTSPSPT